MILFYKRFIKNSLLWWTELILNYSFSHKYNVLLWVIRLLKSIRITISVLEKLMLISDYAQMNIMDKTTVSKKMKKVK